MRDFFGSFKFKIFVFIGLILIGVMIRTAVNGGVSTITADVAGVIVSPVQKLSSSISGFFSGIVTDITSYGSVKNENTKLKKQISDLQSKIVNYNDMKRENDEYKKIYNIYQENPDFKLQSAMVISRDPGQWFSSFSIDKGKADGISPQQPVITQDGLVGIVTEVNATSSVVTTILDPSVSVGVIVSETGDSGVSHGDRTISSKNLLKVGYLAKDSAAAPGDIIVTSGKSGVFPKNLKVATIKEVDTENSGMSLYAVCTPVVDSSSIRSVFVITSFKDKASASSSQGGGK